MMADTEHRSARERLLDATEEIFFECGYDGVSVRQLTDAAGVNVAAVNYHFGGKRNLYLEVLRRRFSALAAVKLAQLQQIIDSQAVPDLRQLIAAYVSFHLGEEETTRNSQRFQKLLSRELAEDAAAMEMLLQELVTPIHKLLQSAIRKVRPQLSDAKISLCISSITGQLFHFVRCPEMMQQLAGEEQNPDFLRDAAAHITEFSLRGIGEEPLCDLIP